MKKGAIKTPEEIEVIREGGHRLAVVLHAVANMVAPGITTGELDAFAEKMIREGGDEPAFKDYKPDGAKRAFPATLCISVNNEVVHGIPGDRVLNNGDIVGLDLGIRHRGLYTDMAVTVPVGTIDPEAKKLIQITREALEKGISAAKAGGRIGDIGHAIEAHAEPYGYGIVQELGGHGVGYAVHELPYIPNYGEAGTGELLRLGMVLAIEPMFNEGGEALRLAPDQFTYVTKDGSRSAHFEHTILVGERGAEILTK